MENDTRPPPGLSDVTHMTLSREFRFSSHYRSRGTKPADYSLLGFQPSLHVSCDMAIHSSYLGREMTIVINGNLFEGYDDASAALGLTLTKRYVELITGAVFHVNFVSRKAFPASYPVVVRVIINDQQIISEVVLYL
ncbi:hypothetical protein DM02DRAFT_663953 [Periconia macrospinosa]|uniref:Uncharacterized protein n=1 Tax=Periconia macrospinosa TaxID=97972 RepID=A0A2V1D0C1_9PLEO|nr:hypothetical protein DM02DRAFT_663953 [Periconia macrospinosa]